MSRRKRLRPMSHATLTDHVVAFFFTMGFRIVCKEMHSRVREVPDIYAVDRTGSVVVEVKSTRKDFLADANKTFRQRPKEGLGRWRFYASYEGIVNIEDLPPKWGLIWVNEEGVVRIVHGKSFVNRLNDNTFWFPTNPENEYWALYSLVRKAVSWGVGANGEWAYNKDDFRDKGEYFDDLEKSKEEYAEREFVLDNEPIRDYDVGKEYKEFAKRDFAFNKEPELQRVISDINTPLIPQMDYANSKVKKFIEELD